MPLKGEFKEFCKRGHLRTPENLKGRSCKECNRIMELARNNTDEGRAKRHEIEKRHKETGRKAQRCAERWQEIKDNPAEKAKRSEYRKLKISDRRQYLARWRKEHPEQTLETNRRNSNRAVEEIRPHYAQATLGLKRKDIVLPDEVIEVQRLRIQIKREMKRCNQSKL